MRGSVRCESVVEQPVDLSKGASPHFSPTFCCRVVSISPDCVALGRPARRTARVCLRGLRILSEDWKEPRSERRGSRCPAPPEPEGRRVLRTISALLVIDDVRRHRHLPRALTSTARPERATPPSPRAGSRVATPCQDGVSAASRQTLVSNADLQPVVKVR